MCYRLKKCMIQCKCRSYMVYWISHCVLYMYLSYILCCMWVCVVFCLVECTSVITCDAFRCVYIYIYIRKLHHLIMLSTKYTDVYMNVCMYVCKYIYIYTCTISLNMYYDVSYIHNLVEPCGTSPLQKGRQVSESVAFVWCPRQIQTTACIGRIGIIESSPVMWSW